MKRHSLSSFVLAALIIVCATTALADALTIRLVEASNSGRGVGDGLRDVAGLLRNNMPFSSYVLLDTRQAAVPGNGIVTMQGGYRVEYSGGPGSLTVTIQRGGKVLLRSTVALTSVSPVVVGGFPSGNGKAIFVFTLRGR